MYRYRWRTKPEIEAELDMLVYLARKGQPDCYGYGWRAYDVAVFLWQMALQFGWDRTGSARTTRRWNAFLRVYSETRSLTAAELRATKLFVPIRHIWLLGVHAQGAETWGSGFMNEDYFDRHIRFVRQAMKHYELA